MHLIYKDGSQFKFIQYISWSVASHRECIESSKPTKFQSYRLSKQVFEKNTK